MQSVPADLVITDARIIDGTGDVKEHAHIVITDGHIVEISVADSAPNGKIHIDAFGKTIIPGLIDVHQHLFSHVIIESDSALAAYIDEELPAFLEAYLRHGVTTIKSVADFRNTILDVRERIARGELAGPRLYAVGPAFTAPGGHPASTVCADDRWCAQRIAVEVGQGQEDRALVAVQLWAKKGVDAIKLVYDDSDGTLPKLSPSVMEAIAQAAHREGIPVTAHTLTLSDARDAVEAGVDGVEHGVVDQLVDEAFVDLLLTHGIYYIPTLTVANMQTRKSPELTKTAKANYSRLLASGVKIAAGSDFGPPGLATIAELFQMAQNGASHMQAIQAGTRNAAEHLGVLDSLGTIEPGKVADLIVLAENPLEDFEALERIDLVLQQGRIVVDNRNR